MRAVWSWRTFSLGALQKWELTEFLVQTRRCHCWFLGNQWSYILGCMDYFWKGCVPAKGNRRARGSFSSLHLFPHCAFDHEHDMHIQTINTKTQRVHVFMVDLFCISACSHFSERSIIVSCGIYSWDGFKAQVCSLNSSNFYDLLGVNYVVLTRS